MPTLPPELLLKVFECYFELPTVEASTTATLSHCCLVSKAWLEPARDTLYKDIFMKFGAGRHEKSWFAVSLLSSSHNDHERGWGIEPWSPVASVLAHPHLAARARSMIVAFPRSGEALEESMRLIKKRHGARKMRRAFGKMFGEVVDACPALRRWQFTSTPGWAVRSITSSLASRSVNVQRLSLEPHAQDDEGFEVLGQLLGSLSELQELVMQGKSASDIKWTTGPRPLFQLRSLGLLYSCLGAFPFLTSSSSTSLRDLRLTNIPDEVVDLSLFHNLTNFSLVGGTPLFLAQREQVEKEEARPRWIPPASSIIQKLSLSPILPFFPLPPIPGSVKTLKLIVLGATAQQQIFPAEHDFPFFQHLLILIDTLPALRTLVLDWAGASWKGRKGYSWQMHRRLHKLCAERGVELEDGIERELQQDTEAALQRGGGI